MKYKLLSSILFIGIFSFSFSQITYGIKSGIQYTNVTVYHPHSKPRIGLQFGGFAKIPIDEQKKWVFQPELLYMNHGEINDLGNVEEKYFINYITIPLMVKRYLSDHDNTFYAEIGPQIAFKIHQNTQDSAVAFWSGRTPLYGPDYDEVSTIDVSLGLGVGFTINRKIDFGFRYNYGFTDVYPDAIGENNAKTNTSSTLALSVLYTF